MFFKKVLGHDQIKEILVKEVSNNRVPHAQLFSHAKGTSALPMALAFSMFLFCKNKQSSDSCGICPSCVKMMKLMHPDLHFFFPSKSVNSKKSSSKELFSDFREIILKDPYIEPEDWYQSMGMKSAGEIRVSDARVINKIANLRSYEGEYKVFIIWCPEKMNNEANNKLLKNIEEPHPKTIFLLISEHSHLIIPTILSRLQTKSFKKIPTSIIFNALKLLHPDLNHDKTLKIIEQYDNNYNHIRKEMSGKLKTDIINQKFIDWIRMCFLSKNQKSISQLIDFCNTMATLENGFQLNFIKSASEVFRHAFLVNYNPLIKLGPKLEGSSFNFNNFSNKITANNIFEISELLDESYYALSRRANAKILFLDLSFSIGQLLHK